MDIQHEIRVRVLPGLWHQDLWCNPTFTSNLLLKELLTSVSLLTPTYSLALTNHYGTPTTRKAKNSTFWDTLLKAFSKSTNVIHSFLFFARYFSWNCLIIKIASVVPRPGQRLNCISSVLIVSRMMFLTTLSKNLRTWSCNYRSSPSEVFYEKGVPKICSIFTGQHPCQSVISIKFQSNFIEMTLWHVCSFSCKFTAYFHNTFYHVHLWVTASVTSVLDSLTSLTHFLVL